MAENCLICREPIPALQTVKTPQGCICKRCSEDIPASLNVKAMSAEALRDVASYQRELKESGFDVTASYGSLLLDEMNGYAILADKTDSDVMPVGKYEIYDLSDITKIGLYPVKPRAEKNNVVCDVEFSLEVDRPPIKAKRIIRVGVKCTYKHVKGSATQVEWCEPGDLSLFRNMLDQSIKAAVSRITKDKLPALTKNDLDLFQAESALLLKEGYSGKDVMDHKERLTKAFCDLPDARSYENVLEHYSSVVFNELKRKEKEGSDYK